MVRAPFYDKNGIKRGAWSSEEDDKLRAYVERYGHWNWRELPKYAGLARCGKSCRLRWMNYLRPDVKRGNYSAEEKDLIMKLHEEHGNKWSLIAASLPGRTDNEIKNHWHTHLKKRTTSHKTPATSQLTEDQSCESSEFCDQTSHSSGEMEAESINVEDDVVELSSPILESSQSPIDATSTNSSGITSSFLISDTSALSDTSLNCSKNMNIYNLSSPFETFYQEYNTDHSDFWTRPFVEDNMSSQNDHDQYTTCFEDGGASSSYGSIFYDEGMEYLFYQ